MDKVKVETGYVSGKVIEENGKKLSVFRGIPYAAPPTGELRWRTPQQAAAWSGTLDCSAYKDYAPQLSLPGPASLPGSRPSPKPRAAVAQSEDCLHLNIITPAKTASEKLPVMVWMHGGGFVFGSAHEPIFNIPRLAAYGVVHVNVNMRLGPFGIMANRLLSRESPDGVSGNYMFLDMIAALKWVQKNIAAFGGDPANVTIFGESGGGAKVVSLLASPLAKGLFHRVIAESGSPEGKPLRDLEETGDKFFDRLGVAKGKDPLKAARSLPWQKIVETEQNIIGELHLVGRGGLWDVAIDGWFMPQKPLDIFKAGKQNPVPYILVANLGELGTAPGAYLIPAYVALFSGAAKTGVNAHAMIFDQVPGQWRKEGCFSSHAMELGYVFGDWDNTSGFWLHVLGIAGSGGAKSLDPGLTDTDRKISELMMSIWTQYAKTGDPRPADLTWPAWNSKTGQYLYIKDKPQVKSGYSDLAKLAPSRA